MRNSKKTISRSAVVVIISVFSIAIIVTAATTISDNIATGGNLTVTGRTTTTSATSSVYLMVGSKFSLPNGFDYNEDLAVSGDVVIAGKATTTTALIVGTGSYDNLDFDNGDLYVQGNAEFDSLVYLSTATATSATTTAYLYVGSDFVEPPTIDFVGDLLISDDLVATGTATITEDLMVGWGNITATSTIVIGDSDTAGCFKIRDADADAWTYCYTDAGNLRCTATDVCDR